jgi:glycosyltransferase involved in cell wall biosynthesis
MSGNNKILTQSCPVVVFIPSLHGGGAERAMLIFAGELAKRGFRVDLVLGRLTGPYIDRIPKGINAIDLKSPRMLRAIPRFAGYLRRVNPQAIFSTITHANIAAIWAAKLARISSPVVVRQSNAPKAETKDSVGRYIASKILPRVYPAAAGVIAVSKGVKVELLELNPSLERLTYVVPTPVLGPDVRELASRDPEHPWFNEEAPIVLSAGRLERHKGMLDLVRSFKIVADRSTARLVIIGEGTERNRIEKELKILGISNRVSLPGFYANPFSLMRRARVFALASHYEGLPNVLIQALAVGTQVVATDCNSGPREILDNGRLGALVPVGDTRSLAEAILQSLHRHNPSEAEEIVWQRYGVELATTRYLEIAGIAPSPQA